MLCPGIQLSLHALPTPSRRIRCAEGLDVVETSCMTCDIKKPCHLSLYLLSVPTISKDSGQQVDDAKVIRRRRGPKSFEPNRMVGGRLQPLCLSPHPLAPTQALASASASGHSSKSGAGQGYPQA